jgi:hypothetical protein
MKRLGKPHSRTEVEVMVIQICHSSPTSRICWVIDLFAKHLVVTHRQFRSLVNLIMRKLVMSRAMPGHLMKPDLSKLMMGSLLIEQLMERYFQ